MRKWMLIAAICSLSLSVATPEVTARGGGGGGGRGGGGFGGFHGSDMGGGGDFNRGGGSNFADTRASMGSEGDMHGLPMSSDMHQGGFTGTGGRGFGAGRGMDGRGMDGRGLGDRGMGDRGLGDRGMGDGFDAGRYGLDGDGGMGVDQGRLDPASPGFSGRLNQLMGDSFPGGGAAAGGMGRADAGRAADHFPDSGMSRVAGNRMDAATRPGNRTDRLNPVQQTALGNAVRQGFDSNYGRNMFNRGWLNDRNGWYPGWGWDDGDDDDDGYGAWDTTDWPDVSGYVGYDDDAQPYNYDYGNNITYNGSDDTVYYGNTPTVSGVQYYQEAQNLANSAPAQEPPHDKWKSLGVYSLIQGNQTNSTTLFELAVDPQGTIAGNYYNALSGDVEPLRGAVDKKTQRVSWVVGNNKDVIYDSGLLNLTKDQTPILIHFGKDRTQQWTLVRQDQAAGSSTHGQVAGTGSGTAKNNGGATAKPASTTGTKPAATTGAKPAVTTGAKPAATTSGAKSTNQKQTTPAKSQTKQSTQ